MHSRTFDIDGLDDVVDAAMAHVLEIVATLVLGLLFGVFVLGGGGPLIVSGIGEAIQQILAFLTLLAVPARK